MNNNYARYLNIAFTLLDDNAIGKGIIRPEQQTPLIFFFMNIWGNPMCRHWLMPNLQRGINEGRMMMLIGWMHGHNVFRASLYKNALAQMLNNQGVTELNVRTIQNYMTKPLPKSIAREVLNIHLGKIEKSQEF